MADSSTRLLEVLRVFLRLGTTAFGGPAAHIALLEDEVVRRRAWVTRDAFLDYLGATNLIPGPNSTEMAIHLGYVRAGWPGLVVAGVSFILPAALLTTWAAAAYRQYGTVPAFSAVLAGMTPVVVAVIVEALWALGRTALKRPSLVVVGALSGAALLGGVHELWVLAMAGLLAWVLRPSASPLRRGLGAVLPVSLSGAGATAVPFALGPLFFTFAKIGSVLFGSGYVLLAFIRADFVERLGWLTERQLLDATVVGLMTPGPVFTTATFIGYLLGGGKGAAVATAGIFLPAFVFVAISGPLVPRIRRSAAAAAVLDGVTVASLALVVLVAWSLARTAIVDTVSAALAIGAFVLLRRRVHPTWLIAGGALVGLLRQVAG